ncbi:Oidioi.mRNA.OKI2018_I69.chr1.g3852.t1.cds [Oikopleura dioica]|uniref:non-specific serine/threonine protein kinase n=1 Tax=Oikopleura dioica TaxID=34765 RepID=A0ABN7SZP7_OIKDI|nr:Oidioi.mRNA.OKI2018_I69.chr1.g3852.t1.cds [Oikopleura dioica]
MTVTATLKSVDLPAIEKRIPELAEMMDFIGTIGSGTFATVYLCKFKEKSKSPENLLAVKVMLPIVNPKRIETETGIMYKADGKHSVMPLLYDMGDPKTGTSALVMPYFEHTDFSHYFDKLTLFEIKCYIYGLLDALAHLNRLGIVHRDVKPANYLFQQSTLRGQLADFGLSEFVNKKEVLSETKMNFDDKCYEHDCLNQKDSICNFCIGKPTQRVSRSGSPGFRAPEILIKSHRQDGMIDVWAAGVCLLSTLARRYPFFPRADDLDALIQIGAVVGSENLKKACKALKKKGVFNFQRLPVKSQLKDIVKALRINSWEMKKDENGEATFDKQLPDDTDNVDYEKAVDLLSNLLEANPLKRFSAEKALQHEFFK